MQPDSERRWRTPGPIDVDAVLGLHRRGAHDPAYRKAPDGSIWRAVHTPDGPGAVAVSSDAPAGEVVGRAWGPGAPWLVESLPGLLGAGDDPDSLPVDSDVLRRLVARSRGLRIGRSDRVWEALVAAVMEQKVVGAEAYRAWRYLLRRYGTRAPGPVELLVPPPRPVWREITEADWHRSGLEPVRMRTIRHAATYDVETKADVLTALPGIGRWTAAHVRFRALGDADAVPFGDYHVPSIVGQKLAGEPVDDAGMAELLKPYAGHRYRVVRMCELHGEWPQRRAPRMPVRDYRRL
ncbi:3-methyladenine DNA glycosylase [Gordonia iterans]|uniref:3-methyladenine DNA glycosylase n=1 Tax=Gordonia iterans TaxID=1004901 RepID=A0A2S0KJD4_9ACTN|nr:3-methyladenine DNA glycosylase [Gordonia iterans]AVM01795.1 3-methyladenine DNA glycosylase [Gordonia iterans]